MRTQVLEAGGLHDLRLWTSDLFKERKGVLETVRNELHYKR